MEVTAISVGPTEKSDAVDDCHLVTVPVFPVILTSVPGVVDVQIVWVPVAILPPTLAGSTVIVAVAELAVAQLEPLGTTGLK